MTLEKTRMTQTGTWIPLNRTEMISYRTRMVFDRIGMTLVKIRILLYGTIMVLYRTRMVQIETRMVLEWHQFGNNVTTSQINTGKVDWNAVADTR
jgi:hypothetical protein